MIYYYFVSYKTEYGWGRIEVLLSSKIIDIADIEHVERLIEEGTGKSVTVMNFQLLRDEPL